MSAASPGPRSPLTGMKTAPSLARAAKRGAASRVVADHSATRDRGRRPERPRARAIWLAAGVEGTEGERAARPG